MLTIIKGRISKRQREQGVAVLLAIGVLALLLVFTMSFAASALHAKRMAELSSSIQAARMGCDDTTETVLTMLSSTLNNPKDAKTLFPAVRIMKKGTNGSAWDGLYFTTTMVDSSSDVVNDGLVNALSLKTAGLDYLPTSLPSGVNTSWLFDKESQVIGSTPVDVITRRFAFMLIDESGKLDPNVIFHATQAPGAVPVNGSNVNEMDLSSLGLPSAVLTGMRNNTPPIGEWFSNYHLARVLNFSQSDLNKVQPVIFPHRMPDTLEPMTDAYNLQDAASETVTDLVDKLPWLTNWVESGHFDSGTMRARNLAANIIDYSDTDYNAKHDFDVSDDSTPTYFGMEKVPYIARMSFRVTNTSYTSGGRTWPRLTVSFRPELVNVHGDLSSYTTDAYVEAEVMVRFTDQGGNVTSATLTLTRTLDPATATAEGAFNTSGYIRTIGHDDSENSRAADRLNGSTSDNITNASLTVNRVVVRKSSTGDWWDFGKPGQCDTFSLAQRTDLTYVGYSAICPVSNLHESEWVSEVSITDKMTAPYTLSTTTCPEWWTDNTLYIRNNTMQHPIELGSILRMEPFDSSDVDKAYRTFNLVDYKYNGDPEVPGHYSDATDSKVDDRIGDTLDDDEGNGGDRNLLDMVRVGNNDITERVVSGRVNINTRSKKVLQALFKSITTMNYSSESPHTPIDGALVDTFIDNVLTYTGDTPLPVGVYSNYRNPPIYGLLFQDTMTTLPEDQREYLLNMTRQLVTAEHNFFSAVVATQIIKDVGAIHPATAKIRNVDCQLGRYDAGGDLILSQQRMFLVLYRNAFNNRLQILRLEYLDE